MDGAVRRGSGVLLGAALMLGGVGCMPDPLEPPPAPPVEAPITAPPVAPVSDAGAEAPPITPAPDAGTGSPPVTSAPDAGSGTPPEPAADAGPEPDPYARFPEVPAPACIPASVKPREATPCLVRQLWSTGQVYSEAHLDALGRSLSFVSYDADGGVTRRVTAEYQGALEVRRVDEDGSDLAIDTWEYDGKGRETRHARQFRYGTVEQEWVSETRYGPQGRTEEILHWADGRPDGRTGFEYNAQGRLVLIARTDDYGDVVEETFLTYHPNGQRKSWSYRPYTTMGGEMDEEYDEQGRLIWDEWCSYKLCANSTYVYDSAGRRTGAQHWTGGDANSTTTVLTRYDSAGRRTVEQSHAEAGPYDPAEPRSYIRDETRRFFYVCGSEALVREELDVDGDSVADGLHTLERDARGRLVRESFSGALLWGEPAVREYRYDCGSGRD